MKLQETGTAREQGLDCLRMVCMGMVLILHMMGVGGILGNTTRDTAQYRAAWLLETYCYCAVNCYAILTGYVMIGKQRRPGRLLELWLEALVYSVGTTLLIRYGFRENVEKDVLIQSFFPLFRGQYWYFSAYMGMMLLLPYLNRLLEGLSRKEYRQLLVIILVGFSLLPNFFQADPFRLVNGYGMAWLMMMYAVGGYIRRFMKPGGWGTGRWLGVFFAIGLLIWGNHMLMNGFTAHVKLPGERNPALLWRHYDSPLMVLQAAALFLAFRSWKVRSGFAKKLIAVAAPASFGVYLLHMNLVSSETWKGKFGVLADGSAMQMVWKVLAVAAVLYCVCSLVDLVRIGLFRLLGISRLCRKLDHR